MKYTKARKGSELFSFQDCFTAACLAAAVAITPIIVRVKKLPVSADELSNAVREVSSVYDAFSYYKSNILIISAVLLLLFYVTGVLIEEIEFNVSELKHPVFIASVAYLVLAFLSSVFSKYRQVSFGGMSDRYEGVFVLIAYIVVMLSVRRFVKSVKHARLILVFLTIAAIGVGIVGVMQFAGLNPYTSEIGRRLMLGSYYEELPTVTSVFTAVYSTVYNPNCMGLFASLMIPVLLVNAVVYPVKSVVKYLLFVAGGMMLICMYGSESEAGFLGLMTAVLAAVVSGCVYLYHHTVELRSRRIMRYTAIGVVALAALVFVFNIGRINSLVMRFIRADSTNYAFNGKDLRIGGDRAHIFTGIEGGDFYLGADGDSTDFTLYDTGGNPLVAESSQPSEQSEEVMEYIYQIPNIGVGAVRTWKNLCSIQAGGVTIILSKQEDGSIAVANRVTMNPIDINAPIPSIGFKGLEYMASGRGFIWSRSLPVFFRSVVLGSGPDTFVFRFPQYDVVGKLRYQGEAYIIVDKPHNMYLQVGINTGLISLCCLLFLFVYYIYASLKTIANYQSNDRLLLSLIIGVFCGVCGYLVCALSTDSVVSVAPVFWASLGLGFGLNTLAGGMQMKKV